MFLLEFDIAAFFIDALVLWFFYQRKTLPTMQNKTFSLMIITAFFVTVFDFSTTVTMTYCEFLPRWFIWFINCFYYIGINSLPMICAAYTLALVGKFRKFFYPGNILLKVYLFCPIIISYGIILLTPLLSKNYVLAFYLDEINTYCRSGNIFFYLLYGISGFYLLGSIVTLIVYHKEIETVKIIMFGIYTGTAILTVVIQMLFDGVLVECFGIAIATLAFFFYLQRPEEVIDNYTGLFNQNAFVKMFRQQLSTDEQSVCIALIIDDIPFLTGTFGIRQMNMYLHLVAEFLQQSLKTTMIYSLYNGIFTIALKGHDRKEIDRIINLIQVRFRRTWLCDGVEIKLYSRICVIMSPENAKSTEDVLDIINFVTNDERYKQGVVFANEMDIENKKRTAYIERVLRTGLSDGRYEVYYQPLYSAAKKRLIGAEALIRLRDENGDFISPEDFIPISEKNGTILRIGEFVFESVCKTLSSINPAEYGIEKVDINLSVAQCMQEILSDQILTIKSMYRLPSSIINLEITETAAAHTPAILLKNMERLAAAGIELSLDDYGSGYSNMNYLLGLPFKMVKIDKYIVWAAFKDERANIALSSTIKMIKALGMTVLAEGCETQQQLEWLVELGCDYLQGYLFSKPVPKDEYLKLMKEAVKDIPPEELKLSSSETEAEDIDEPEELEEL